MCEFGWTGPGGLEAASEHRCGLLPYAMGLGQIVSALMFPLAVVVLRETFREWRAHCTQRRKRGTLSPGASPQLVRFWLALLMVVGLPGEFVVHRMGLQLKFSMASTAGKVCLTLVAFTVTVYYLAVGLVMVLLHRVNVVTQFEAIKPDPHFEARSILTFVAPLVLLMAVTVSLCWAGVLEDNVTVLRISLGASTASLTSLNLVIRRYGKQVVATIDAGLAAFEASNSEARAKMLEAKHKFDGTTQYLVKSNWVGVFIFALVSTTPLLKEPLAFLVVQFYIFTFNILIFTGLILFFVRNKRFTKASKVKPSTALQSLTAISSGRGASHGEDSF